MPNSVAIVTGASQGIGKATALRLARDFSGLALGCTERGASSGDSSTGEICRS